jgi:hypothetical protein
MQRNTIKIELSAAMFKELRIAALEVTILDGIGQTEPEVCKPEDFARECIESVLATRRAKRFAIA